MKEVVLGLVEQRFRTLLATGKAVAMEDATVGIETPVGFDRRSFGSIARRMERNGEILETGYRRAFSAGCNGGMKRLWRIAKI